MITSRSLASRCCNNSMMPRLSAQALKPASVGWSRSPPNSPVRRVCQSGLIRRVDRCPALPAASSTGGSGNNGDGGGRGGRGDGWRDGSDGDDSDHRQPHASVAGLVFALSSALCFPARAGSKSPTDDLVDQLVELVGPIASNLGFSGALGLAAAIALKMVGKAIAVFIGLAFVLVQGLAHFGVVTVHWSEVHQKATKLVDSDGDGDFDKDDMRRIGKSVIGALSEGVPSIGGFCAGFLMGLKIF